MIDARKKIKYNKGDIVTGDFVEIENGAIVKVYPRKSRFLRPNVANIDTLVAVISKKPEPDFLIVDKLLLTANFCNVEYAIVANKADLGKDTYEYLEKNYDFCPIFCLSAKSGEGIDAFKNFLQGKTVALAGQSAVGKTSVTNLLFGSELKIGELSEKSERGKHTTTTSRLIKGDGFVLLDTPGFSELVADISPYDAVMNFPPYDKYLNKCKYPDCKHLSEPDCAVLKDIECGKLSADRHIRYNEILKELQMEYDCRYGKRR